jgi:hypothetical protein
VKDTPAVIERKFRQMLMKRSGEERLKMGCSMHATAQALAKAWISQQHPGARPAELKRLLFLHFYGTDFEPDERKRIASVLSKNRHPARAAILKTSGAGAVREKHGIYRGKKKNKS